MVLLSSIVGYLIAIATYDFECGGNCTRVEWRSIASDEVLIQEIAKQYRSEHDYIKGRFDCTEFSYNLKYIYSFLGYKTNIKLGYLDSNFNYCFEKYRHSGNDTLKKSEKTCPEDYNRAHAWLELPDLNIDLESTSGRIIRQELNN